MKNGQPHNHKPETISRRGFLKVAGAGVAVAATTSPLALTARAGASQTTVAAATANASPALFDISIYESIERWLEANRQLQRYLEVFHDMGVQLSSPNASAWLASNPSAAAAIAKEVVDSRATIQRLTSNLASAAENLHHRAPTLIDITTHLEHNVRQGFVNFENGFAMNKAAENTHQFSQLAPTQQQATVQRMLLPLEHRIEDVTRLASDNSVIRKALKSPQKYEPKQNDEELTKFPEMGTAYRPCSFKKNHRMDGFYSPPTVGWKERLTSDSTPHVDLQR